MEFRDITNLEKLSELSDGSYILVIEDGVAKQISKKNAKFGRGVTTFYISEVVPNARGNNTPIAVQSSTSSGPTIVHEDGSEVTAQEFYDAFISGSVRVEGVWENQKQVLYFTGMSAKSDYRAPFDPTNVVWIEATLLNVTIEIGEAPDE